MVFFGDFSHAPIWLDHIIISLFSRGALGTALFIIVMYTGVMKNGTGRRKELMKVRGELSILATILVIAATSFPQVRNRMHRAGWKKLHRLAYVFYGLIYIHVVLIYAPLALSGRWFYRNEPLQEASGRFREAARHDNGHEAADRRYGDGHDGNWLFMYEKCAGGKNLSFRGLGLSSSVFLFAHQDN